MSVHPMSIHPMSIHLKTINHNNKIRINRKKPVVVFILAATLQATPPRHHSDYTAPLQWFRSDPAASLTHHSYHQMKRFCDILHGRFKMGASIDVPNPLMCNMIWYAIWLLNSPSWGSSTPTACRIDNPHFHQPWWKDLPWYTPQAHFEWSIVVSLLLSHNHHRSLMMVWWFSHSHLKNHHTFWTTPPCPPDRVLSNKHHYSQLHRSRCCPARNNRPHPPKLPPHSPTSFHLIWSIHRIGMWMIMLMNDQHKHQNH